MNSPNIINERCKYELVNVYKKSFEMLKKGYTIYDNSITTNGAGIKTCQYLILINKQSKYNIFIETIKGIIYNKNYEAFKCVNSKKHIYHITINKFHSELIQINYDKIVTYKIDGAILYVNTFQDKIVTLYEQDKSCYILINLDNIYEFKSIKSIDTQSIKICNDYNKFIIINKDRSKILIYDYINKTEDIIIYDKYQGCLLNEINNNKELILLCDNGIYKIDKIKPNKNECIICFNIFDDIYKKTVCIPCGHTNICSVCINKIGITKCQICQTEIESFIRIYD